MMKKNFSFNLLPANRDLQKRWLVQVKVFNAETTKYEFLRKYDSRLNRLKTVEARLLVLPQALASIDEELQKNATYWGSAEEYIKSKTQSPKDSNENEIIGVLEKALENRKPSLRKKSYSSICSKVNNLRKFMTANKLVELKLEDSQKFIKQFKSPTTRNTHRSSLATLLRYAKFEPNHFEALPKEKENREGRLYFTNEQLIAIKEAIEPNNPMLWIACQMQYYCLIRNGEMRDLLVGDIAIESEMIIIRGEIAKNKKTMPVKIPKPFIEPLKQYIGNAEVGMYFLSKAGSPGFTQISTKYLNSTFCVYLKKLGIKSQRRSFYSLKKSGTKALVDKPNANMKAVKRQGRWTDDATFEMYLADVTVMDFGAYLDDVKPFGD
jgi:integrase